MSLKKNNLILILLSFSLIISCGGSSSYPTTSTDSGGGDSGSGTTTTLSLSGYDSCEYYGLQDGSTDSCSQHTSASEITLANLRNSSGATRSVDTSLSSSGTAGFVGANNILQIAEAQAILDDLGREYDGSGATIAILGSGFNDVGSGLTTGTSNNYGYLNDANNIEDTATYTSALAMLNSGNIDGYSIFNKNTSESFSASQGYDGTGTYNGLDYNGATENIQKHSKFKLNGSGTAVSYIYNVDLTDTGVVDDSDDHITDLEEYLNAKVGAFETGTFNYGGLGEDTTSTFCVDDACSRDYHTFVTEDYVGSSHEYQSSIFEYGHGDVANGTALASIIGMSGNANVTGAASGATLNSYKTQIYHRKLLDVEDNYLANNDGHYTDSILEDNTGLILYNALNAAQASSQIVLINNQYRNYTSQFYLDDTTTAATDFYVGYDTTSDPTQVDQFEEFEIYRFNTGIDYTIESASSVFTDAQTGNFVAGNFMSSDSLAYNDGGALNYTSDLDTYEAWMNNSTGESYGNSGTYKYLTDTNVASEYSANISNIKNLLKSNGVASTSAVDNIFVIPTDNKFFIGLVNALTSSEDNTIVTVADVAVNSITYSDTALGYDFDNDSVEDYAGVFKIASMSLDTGYTSNVNGDAGLISVNDCSAVTNAACFIAPGNSSSLNHNGTYTNFDDLDEVGTNGTGYTAASDGSNDGMDQGEYLGSAYVTSAIAVLVGAWSAEVASGDITMTQIVAKLQATAITADNISGCNSEDGTTITGAIDCGDGMINLLAAVDATYTSYIASDSSLIVSEPILYTTGSVSDFAYNLSDTSFSSSLYFGDALTKNASSILSKAKYYDSYNFSYDANLESKVSSESDLASSRYSVLNYFEFDNTEVTKSETIPLGNNLSFTVTSSKSKYDDNEYTKQRIFENPESTESDVSFSNLNFTQGITDKISVKMGFNSYDTDFAVVPEQYAASGSISFASGNEYASLLGDDTGFSTLKFNMSKNLDGYFGFASSEENGSQYLFSKLNYDLGRSFISFSLGTLIEEDNFLGSKTEGALGLDDGTQTTYYGLSFVRNIGNDIDFISKIDIGITEINTDQYSVFKDFRNVRSQETSFALVKHLKDATFGVSYTEPMRVNSGESLISVATGKSLDGSVNLDSEWVSLESSGKERNYELFYKTELDHDDSITLNYVYITEANHIASNPDEQLFVLKYSKNF